MDLTSPKQALRHLWNSLVSAIVTPEPPELNDRANYGIFPDLVACKTGYHPALVLGIQNRAEQFGREFETYHELRDYTVVIVNRMSADDIHEMITANYSTTPKPLSL